MWFNPESIREAMLRSAGTVQRPVDANAIADAKKKAELEKEVWKTGKAICLHCGEEILHTPTNANYAWESESMLGWCEKNRTNKHTPKIEIKEEDHPESL